MKKYKPYHNNYYVNELGMIEKNSYIKHTDYNKSINYKKSILTKYAYVGSSHCKSSRFLSNLQVDILTYIVLCQNLQHAKPLVYESIYNEFEIDFISAYKKYIQPIINRKAITKDDCNYYLDSLQNPIRHIRKPKNHKDTKSLYPRFITKSSFITSSVDQLGFVHKKPKTYLLKNYTDVFAYDYNNDLFAIAHEQHAAVSRPRIESNNSLQTYKDILLLQSIKKRKGKTTSQNLDKIMIQQLLSIYKVKQSRPHAHKNPLFNSMITYLNYNTNDFDNWSITQQSLLDSTNTYIPPIVTFAHTKHAAKHWHAGVLHSANPFHSASQYTKFVQRNPHALSFTGYASPESLLTMYFWWAWIYNGANYKRALDWYYTGLNLYYRESDPVFCKQEDSINTNTFAYIPMRFTMDELVKAILWSIRPDNILY